jgi:hypothetical protein
VEDREFDSARDNNMHNGTFFPIALEPQSFLHARSRLLLCKIARLQAEHADERRRAIIYPPYATLRVRNVDAAADRASCYGPAVRELHPHAALPAGLPFPLPTRWLMGGIPATCP